MEAAAWINLNDDELLEKKISQLGLKLLQRESADAADVSSPSSDPLRAAIVTDMLDRALQQLDESSQLTLVLKLQGCTEAEICEALKCSIRSVRRRAAHIREVLETDED